MRRGWRDERGQSMVEFAVVSIVVLAVIIGILETGRLMLDYITLAEAARAGVRYAIVRGVDVNPPATAGDVQNVVLNTAGLAGMTLMAPQVNVNYSAGNAVGSRVTVVASYIFAPVTPLSSHLGVTITSASQGTICF